MADNEDLETLRKRIDEIDQNIIKLLDERIRICRRIGKIKKRNGKPILDHNRTIKVLERAGRYKEVYMKIIDLCIREQENVATRK